MSGSRVNLSPKFGELNRRPEALTEVNKLGRSLKKRATDVLACFDRPGASNGPTEALNGRLEHLRGFRDLTHGSSRQRRRIARRCLTSGFHGWGVLGTVKVLLAWENRAV